LTSRKTGTSSNQETHSAHRGEEVFWLEKIKKNSICRNLDEDGRWILKIKLTK
jgi:hypothetical protein